MVRDDGGSKQDCSPVTTRRLRTLRLGFVRQVFSLAFTGT